MLSSSYEFLIGIELVQQNNVLIKKTKLAGVFDFNINLKGMRYNYRGGNHVANVKYNLSQRLIVAYLEKMQFSAKMGCHTLHQNIYYQNLKKTY